METLNNVVGFIGLMLFCFMLGTCMMSFSMACYSFHRYLRARNEREAAVQRLMSRGREVQTKFNITKAPSASDKN